LVFTTPADCSFVSILFSRFKKKKNTQKNLHTRLFFHDSRTAVTLRSSHPASQRGVSGMFLSLSLSFHSIFSFPQVVTYIKEGRRWKNIRERLDDLIM
jgi:hypothetical protein